MSGHAVMAAAKPAAMHGPARMTVALRRRQRGKPMANTSGGLRGRAWWLMRSTPRFTLDDLLLTLADGSEGDAPGNLGKYLRGLERAGVVKRLKRREPGASPTSPGHVIWRLARDLGPLAPVWRHKSSGGAVWDPNAGQLLQPLGSTAAPDPADPDTPNTPITPALETA